MLVSFTLENFLSFKNEAKFSLKASPISEHSDSNTFISTVNEIRLLRGGALYGANASGKTNLFRALGFVIGFVKGSAKDSQVNEPIHVSNFKLSTQTATQPSTFEIEFINFETKYRYTFTVDSKSIHNESLYIQKKTKEYLVFKRVNNAIEIEEKYSDANKVKELTRENALFLSTAAMLNIKWASDVISAFDKFKFFGELINLPFVNDRTSEMMEDSKYRKLFQKLLKAGDFGFDEIETELLPIKFDDIKGIMPDSAKKYFSENKFRVVSTIHNQLDIDGLPSGKVSFNLFNEESAGTQKFYNLLGPIVDALFNGHVFIVDEFTSRLHPLLAEQIIKLFHCKKINRNNAQLIIATHNTYLLNEDLYRRDQIYITKKDKFYSSNITTLFDENVRKDANFEKRYIHDKTLGGFLDWKLNENTFWDE